MKIREVSDLHLEFGPLDLKPIGEDVLCLSGDIGIFTDGMLWARNYARKHSVPVLVIPGNHEFYRNAKHQFHTIPSTVAAMRAVADSEPLLHFLEDRQINIDGVTFLGGTLWTDFALNGQVVRDMREAKDQMNDYYKIWKDEVNHFTPFDSKCIHERSVRFLEEELSDPLFADTKKTVVITHHLPSPLSIGERYADSTLNAAYASNLEDLMVRYKPQVWFHGHTHISRDYVIDETRVICNPRGYHGYEVNPEFNPNLIIDV